MIKSLYIHIPFCDDICGYCDFVRVGYNDKLSDLYLIELRKDLLLLSTQYKTIYLGGGTPSSLSVQQFSFLLESMNHLVGSVDEFTIEVNPDSLTIEKAKLYQQAGINRVSLGVQTTNNQLLKEIGRTHTFEDVKKSIELLNFVGISNISMDLIYGLPTQKLDDLESDLNKLLSLSPTHLSLYSLTIEPNSQFSRAGIKEVSLELETEMYLLIQEKLKKHGFIHYEISNYCLPGYESIHNLSYWKYDDYLGIGVGASSKVNHRRFTNYHNINDYIQGKRFLSENLELSKENEMFEYVMMNLRLIDGINCTHFFETFKIDIYDQYKLSIENFVKKDLLIYNKKRLYATDKGRLMLNDILVDFL